MKHSLRTDDGVDIFIENKGIRTATPEVLQCLKDGEDVPPSEYYMRTAATFEVDRDSRYSFEYILLEDKPSQFYDFCDPLPGS